MILAARDLLGFLGGTKSYAAVIGGGLLTLLGVVGVIWAGIQIMRRLMTLHKGDGPPINLGLQIVLLFVGGALATGGLALMLTVSSGGEQTIKELGGGAALMLVPYCV